MKDALELIDRLKGIVEADNEYFSISAKLLMLKLRGPVSDEEHQKSNDAFEHAMRLRQEFIKYEEDLKRD